MTSREAPPSQLTARPSIMETFYASVSAHIANRPGLWLGMIAGLFCVMAVGISLTKRPWCDEGWFASIAYSMIHKGVMGMTVLDPHGFVFAPLVKDIDLYSYWVLPGYIFMQTLWYQVFGLSVFTMRSISVFWGIVTLFSWYYIVGRVTGNRIIGLLAALVLAVDQNFIVAGASGRMDMMCSGLSLAGAAIYLRLRERFHVAVFSACTILAVAMMTHPNAVFGAILVALLALWLDRSRIRWTTIVIAAAPFLVALASWGLYVLKAPDVFVAQMQAQSAVPHRFHFDWNLFQQFKGELISRFGSAYRLRSDSLLVKITGTPAVVYFLAVSALAIVPTLRKQTGAVFFVTLAVIDFVLLSCLQDNWYYLVYILPALSAAVAISATSLWQRGNPERIAVGLVVAAIVFLNTGVIGIRIFHNDYDNRYGRAVDYLQSHAPSDALIVGSGELAFDLGFDGRVVDDCRLGYTSGRRPDYIVLEAHYYQFWFSWMRVHEPQTMLYIKKLLDEDYEVVYDQRKDSYKSMGTSDLPYLIYRRKV